MTDYLYRPTGLDPGRTYRVDTGATNGTPATITRIDPRTAIDGSKVRADESGAVVAFLGSAATLYLRPLDYAANPGTAVTSTGTQFPTPSPDTGAQASGALPASGYTGPVDLSAATSVLVPTPTLAGQAVTKALHDLKAPLASPVLTDTPTAPTAAPGTNTTQIATTAFAKAAIDALIASAPGALDTLDELAAALGDDANYAATIVAALALKAPLASPTFTGIATLPAATNAPAVFNVMVYGATGDGTTDDTAAVQAGVTAAAAVSGSSNGGATVYFPPGTYKLSDVITLGASKLTIQGAGIKATWIKQTGANKHGFYATDKREFTFRDLAFEGTGTGTGDGIYLAATGSYAVFDCRFENVYVEEFGRHGIHTEDLCTSLFSHVRVDGCGSDGFHIGDNGSAGLGGTSLTFDACYANGNAGSGYYLYALKYSNFSGCASDANNYSYQTVLCSGLAFSACGFEATAGSAGHGFFITNGSNSIVMAACWGTNVKATTGIDYYVTANGGSNCSRIVIIGCKAQGGITPLASAKVDTNCQATFINFQPHPSVGITGAGSMQFLSHDNLGLSSYGQAPVNGDEPYLAWLPDTSTFAYGASVAGDSVRRFAVRSDGKTEWGPGNGARDTNLYRSAADTLKTDDTFSAANLQVNGTSIGGIMRPADHNLVGWAYDPVAATTSSAATNGNVYLIRIPIPAAVTVTKLYWSIGTAGVTATSSQNYVGIYDSAGNLLVSTGVDAAVTTTGVQTTTIASTALSAGWVWAALLFNASTPPSPLRASSGSSVLYNVALGASAYRFAVSGATGRTTLASTITPSGNLGGTSYWAALGV